MNFRKKEPPPAPRLSVEQRREVFLWLVAAQDRRMPVSESRAEAASRFGLMRYQLEAIEEEGVDNGWPPL